MKNRLFTCILFICVSLVLVSCGENNTNTSPTDDISQGETQKTSELSDTLEPVTSESIATDKEQESFTLEAWADNWFAAYLGEELIVEDSVPITTERSFNSETAEFSGSFPLHFNVILKDFKENDTGLEYIGSNRQQMGDGGFIMQVKDSSGNIVAVTDDSWKCKVIHDAPLDTSCESSDNPQEGVGVCASQSQDEPDNWKSIDFDDSTWDNATVHSEADVDPKMGYDDIDWDTRAKMIWGPDLETNNTILCRVTVTG